MSDFGQRQESPLRRAPQMEPEGGHGRIGSWLIQTLCRLWAAFVVVVAIGSAISGAWASAGFLAAHALLIWPEIAAYARQRGLAIPRRISAWLALIGSLILLGWGIGGRAPSSEAVNGAVTQASELTRQRTMAEYRSKILSHAVSAIDRSDYYASVYRKLGSARARDANALAPWVALRAAFSPRCDRVDMVEIAGDADRDRLKWFVDCLNHQRFYVTEDQARATEAKFSALSEISAVALAPDDLPGSENAAVEAFNAERGLTLCETALAGGLQDSSSYRSLGEPRVTPHPQRGRVTITRSFAANNALGGQVRSQWDCLLDANEMKIVELKWLEAGEWRVAVGG